MSQHPSIETTATIGARWRREGRTFTAREVGDEFKRQLCEWTVARENRIIAEQPEDSEHVREVAQQIRDHREYHGSVHALGCDGHHPTTTGGAK